MSDKRRTDFRSIAQLEADINRLRTIADEISDNSMKIVLHGSIMRLHEQIDKLKKEGETE